MSVNQPDKIVFVGEALVGNEAVDQLSKFDRALRDFTGAASNFGGVARKAAARGIDGMILTKFDTIVSVVRAVVVGVPADRPGTAQDDKVGAALSMSYITGQPILFIGCGQVSPADAHLRVCPLDTRDLPLRPIPICGTSR